MCLAFSELTTSATVEFVFAPEERDVYSYEHTFIDLAPSGAKPGSGTLAREVKAIALLLSFGGEKRPPGYKHLAPLGRRSASQDQSPKTQDPRPLQVDNLMIIRT